MKGAKYSTHHSTFGCPYSLQNLNKDSCLVDRLSNNSMTEESDWSYASKQKLAVVKAIKGKEVRGNSYIHPRLELHFQHFASLLRIISHCRGWGVLRGILGRDVPPGSPNPDPISDQKCHFPNPFSGLAFRQKLCFHYLD